MKPDIVDALDLLPDVLDELPPPRETDPAARLRFRLGAAKFLLEGNGTPADRKLAANWLLRCPRPK